VAINFGLFLCLCGLSSWHLLNALNSLSLFCTVSLSLGFIYVEWERIYDSVLNLSAWNTSCEIWFDGLATQCEKYRSQVSTWFPPGFFLSKAVTLGSFMLENLRMDTSIPSFPLPGRIIAVLWLLGEGLKWLYTFAFCICVVVNKKELLSTECGFRGCIHLCRLYELDRCSSLMVFVDWRGRLIVIRGEKTLSNKRFWFFLLFLLNTLCNPLLLLSLWSLPSFLVSFPWFFWKSFSSLHTGLLWLHACPVMFSRCLTSVQVWLCKGQVLDLEYNPFCLSFLLTN